MPRVNDVVAAFELGPPADVAARAGIEGKAALALAISEFLRKVRRELGILSVRFCVCKATCTA